MNKLPNIHPGEVLREEFLIPMGISQYRLAKEIAVPEPRISAICNGMRAITADTAVRLARFFGTSAGFGSVFRPITIPRKLKIQRRRVCRQFISGMPTALTPDTSLVTVFCEA
jgi:addiction module HigA family antidote